MNSQTKHISFSLSGLRQLLLVSFLLLAANVNFSQDIKVSQLSVAKPSENAFGAFVHNNELYYCIDRGKKSTKKSENQNGRVFLDLFKIGLKQKNKTTGKPIRLSDTLNTDLNEGPIEITKDNKYLYYSRNLVSFKDTSVENKLGIYISESIKGGWDIPVQFPFNNDSFNIAHPTINEQGDMLIFISDMPGGIGKSDLYVSYNKSGEWSTPENLGDVVNTPFSETFPYFVNNTLYFSSTREGGLGGMDLYKSKRVKGKWQNPIILPKPINSEYDDFSFFLNDDGKSGYFSSNRTGMKDGIFYFEKKIPEPTSYQQQTIGFCFEVTDSMMEEAEDLEFTWEMGDGTKLKGLTVDYCYKDTGVFTTQLSIYEKSVDRTYYPAASDVIVIDAKGLPVIEYEIENGNYVFSINDKWVKISYDAYYWEVADEKIFEPQMKVSVDEIDRIRLVVWNKKDDNSTQGIELLLK